MLKNKSVFKFISLLASVVNIYAIFYLPFLNSQTLLNSFTKGVPIPSEVSNLLSQKITLYGVIDSVNQIDSIISLVSTPPQELAIIQYIVYLLIALSVIALFFTLIRFLSRLVRFITSGLMAFIYVVIYFLFNQSGSDFSNYFTSLLGLGYYVLLISSLIIFIFSILERKHRII